MHKSRGFSMIEVLIAVVVLGIMAGWAVPSFRDLVQGNRLTSESNELLSALVLARSEALKRNTRVTACRATDADGDGQWVDDGCSTTIGEGWEEGWLVFVDSNDSGTCQDVDGNGLCDDSSTKLILRQHEALAGDGDTTLRGDSNTADYVSYVPTGGTELVAGGVQMGALTACTSGYATGKQITISSTGRARVSDTTCAS